jgi:hypothetical protein
MRAILLHFVALLALLCLFWRAESTGTSQAPLLPLNFTQGAKLGDWPQIILPHGDSAFLVEFNPPRLVPGSFLRGVFLVDAKTGAAQRLSALADFSIALPLTTEIPPRILGTYIY